MTECPSTVHEQLCQTAARIRRRNLQMIHEAAGGHTGGDLSAADILTTLYFGGVLQVDPADPTWPERDRFFLSKGHCSGVLYTTLALRGFFPEAELRTFMGPLSRLNGHPNRQVPGVEANTGALGHGLPIAVGAALASQMDGRRLAHLRADGRWRAAGRQQLGGGDGCGALRAG